MLLRDLQAMTWYANEVVSINAYFLVYFIYPLGAFMFQFLVSGAGIGASKRSPCASSLQGLRTLRLFLLTS